MAAIRSGLAGRCAVVVAVIATVCCVTGPASAHTPHDVVADVELSPDFEGDHTLFAIVRESLLKSDDGGDTWTRLVRGLDNRFQLRAVEVSPQNKQVLFLGSRGDGIYRSSDGGQTWANRSRGLPTLDVRSLSISPGSSDNLFATIETNGVPTVVRTEDGGLSWSTVSDAGAASVIEFANDDPEVVLSGSEGGPVRMSRDGGSTWRKIADFPGSGGITAIVASPNTSGGHSIFVATHDKGLFHSTDDAQSFEPVGTGITDASIVSVAVSPHFAVDQTLWVSTWSTGVFTSGDGGASWSDEVDGLTTNRQADLLGRSQFGPLRVSNTTVGIRPILFLGAFEGLFRSSDAGMWQELETQSSRNISSMAISSSYGEDTTIAVATYLNGAFLSEDGGRTWTAINDGLAYQGVWTRSEEYYARLTSIGISPSFASDRTLFASERGYVLRSETAGDQWRAQIPDGLVVEGEEPPDYTLWAFSSAYAQDQTVLLGSSRGKVFRSRNGGSEFAKVGQMDSPVSAIATSPAFASDHTVIAGTSTGMQRSADAGRTWERIGLGGQRVTSLAISPDYADSGRVFAGTTNGLYATDGTGWTPVTISGVSPTSSIEAVAVSPEFASDGTLLVSVRGRGLFRSADGGATFAPTGEALLERNIVLANFYHGATEAILFSPDFQHDHTIFGQAGTAVVKSTDGGETWESLVLPLSTHDTAVEAAPGGLLPMIDPSDLHHGRPDKQSAAPPVGRAIARPLLAGLGCAALAFAGLTFLRRRRLGAWRPFESIAARVVGSFAVLVVVVAVLAA
ncbi:MAG: hypothetical protein EXQ71_10065 [Acidimicrobiia bacterium]|nr:hypothetical protein [Acidimicrobiia bacterium]